MSAPSFLLNFQERACSTSLQKHGASSMATADSYSVGTETFTEGREEPDQDISLGSTGTETFTKVREESDQDIGFEQYYTLPRTISCC